MMADRFLAMLSCFQCPQDEHLLLNKSMLRSMRAL